MTQDLFFALVAFCAVGLFTPGPNNMMLMTSGANFGLRRTWPHLFGVDLGFAAMVLPVGLGVMQIFEIWPITHTILKFVSVAYLLYLAWKIANAGAPRADGGGARPLSFLQACAFQWVNPKAWSMILGALTLYAPGRDLGAILWVAGVYAAVGFFSALSWTTLGTNIRRILTNQTHLRLFNWTMALLLLASMGPVLWQ